VRSETDLSAVINFGVIDSIAGDSGALHCHSVTPFIICRWRALVTSWPISPSAIAMYLRAARGHYYDVIAGGQLSTGRDE